MRIPSLALLAPIALLAACGGPETSQANSPQANISKDSRTEVNAQASSVTPADTNTANGD